MIWKEFISILSNLHNFHPLEVFTSYYGLLKSQNKITEFFMILAWLCRFKYVFKPVSTLKDAT